MQLAEKGSYRSISPKEAREKIQAGAVIVDVRSPDEYEQGHLPGAVLLPLPTLQQQPDGQLPDKQAVLLVYCRSGVRSKEAAQRLAAFGYTQVYDLGGILNWPYEVVKE